MEPEKQYYENADLWDEKRYIGEESERFKILRAKIPAAVTSLVDIGCGNGLFLKMLQESKHPPYQRLCGVERSTIALSNVTGEKIEASIEKLPLKDNEFDLVSCQEVLEHLPQSSFQSAVRELSRVARRWILVSVPYREDLDLSLTECSMCRCRFNPSFHLRSFDEERMRNLFSNHGFICSEIFLLAERKKLPKRLEQFFRALGSIKRLAFNEPRIPMVAHTVCPACGFSPRDDLNLKTVRPALMPNTSGEIVRKIFKTQKDFRWIAALYHRGDGSNV